MEAIGDCVSPLGNVYSKQVNLVLDMSVKVP